MKTSTTRGVRRLLSRLPAPALRALRAAGDRAGLLAIGALKLSCELTECAEAELALRARSIKVPSETHETLDARREREALERISAATGYPIGPRGEA